MIRLERVSKAFSNEETGQVVQALENVDLGVGRDEFVCLLGPSGCGKSTLLNLVAGFERPTAGRVLFEDREVESPSPQRGVVFQEPALFPWLTVEQNVEFGLRTTGVPPTQRREITEHFLSVVGLSEFARARPHQLSGGMKQRVQLARTGRADPRPPAR